jgi:hypothetical protein
MKPATKPQPYDSIRSTSAYDELLKALYMKAKPRVEEIEVPPVKVIAIQGNEPPASRQYQDAIAVLYGVGYGLKMGLKFDKLKRPKGYFDYRVGALESLWWSTGMALDMKNPRTLRWQAYLMTPHFISNPMFEEARKQATTKHPELPYDAASLEMVFEGRAVQILHVGPYDEEERTLEQLHRYINEHGLRISGRHHEIYLSDPRRTKPAKLKTVIRYAVEEHVVEQLSA